MATKEYSINTGEVRRFGTVDYAILVITLAISSSIGIYYAIRDRKRNTTKDFLMGGRNMNAFPVAMSLMVTYMAANNILGNPADVYNYNTMYVWVAVGFIFAITISAFIFMPFFYDLQVTCIFEYLQLRFNLPVRVLASGLVIVQSLMYMAFLLYSPSLALNAVTGVNLWGIVGGLASVVTLYTALGGMKAVLWTDTFQAGVIFAGLLAVLIQGSIVQGGFAKAWEIADNRSRILLDDFNFDPKTRHSAWSVGVGSIFFWVYLYGVTQAQIQRCFACPSVKKAQIAMFVNLPGLMLIVILCSMIGVVMYAFYSDCHPVTYGVINKLDQLLPLYVMDILGHVTGVPGIFLSCLVAGSLSSMSSVLNALCTLVFKDWIQGFNCYPNASEFKNTIITKLLVAVFGIMSIGLTYVVSQLGDILQALYAVFGVLNGPVLGVMTLGMFFPWANRWGAVFGFTGSLMIMLWIGMGAFVNGIRTIPPPTFVTACNWTARPTPAPPITTILPVVEESLTLEPLYRMSYMWYPGLGMILVWGVGMFVSVLTGATKPTSLDARLILPIFDKLFPYLPEKILNFLRFGIVHKGKYDRPPLDIHKMSSETGSDSRPEKEKPSHDVTNGHVTPKTEKDNIDSKDVKIEMQSQENKAYHADGDEDDGVTKTRL